MFSSGDLVYIPQGTVLSSSRRQNLRAKILSTPELAVFVRYTNSSAQVVDMEGETWEVDPKNVFFNQLNEVEHAC